MFLCFLLDLSELYQTNHMVKLHSVPLITTENKAFMVEYSRLIVNEYQIWVNDCFLNF